MRSPKSRAYRMRRRAEQVDQTRLRITEAAIRLHTTVGPANTSIAGVAEEAGVTRLTVYRHFPDLDALFLACSSHWRALHPRPSIDAWRAIPDPGVRARRVITELYAWYRENGDDMLPIYRDAAAMPRAARDGLRAQVMATVDALIGPGPDVDHAARTNRALAGHVVSFWTWHSLTQVEGLDDRDAIAVAVRFLSAPESDPAASGSSLPMARTRALRW